jgi:tRNA (guanine-N7-)-methyltransferase
MYSLPLLPYGFLDLTDVFGRPSEKILEIGFGDGQSLASMALAAPDKDFIGVEVYKRGICRLLAAIEKEALRNIRIFYADALEVLEYKIPNNSLTTIQVFFADPWSKTRHRKRRLIQPGFIGLSAQKLKLGGILHLATDCVDYANYMITIMSKSPAFENMAGVGQFGSRPPHRPLTKYEQKGLQLSHKTWELIFKRTGL